MTVKFSYQPTTPTYAPIPSDFDDFDESFKASQAAQEAQHMETTSSDPFALGHNGKFNPDLEIHKFQVLVYTPSEGKLPVVYAKSDGPSFDSETLESLVSQFQSHINTKNVFAARIVNYRVDIHGCCMMSVWKTFKAKVPKEKVFINGAKSKSGPSADFLAKAGKQYKHA